MWVLEIFSIHPYYTTSDIDKADRGENFDLTCLSQQGIDTHTQVNLSHALLYSQREGLIEESAIFEETRCPFHTNLKQECLITFANYRVKIVFALSA